MVYDPQKYDYAKYSRDYYARNKETIKAKYNDKRAKEKDRMRYLEVKVANCVAEKEPDGPLPEFETKDGKPYLPLETILVGYQISPYFETEGNRKKNIGDIKRAYRCLGQPVDFYPYFFKLDQLQHQFETAKQISGKKEGQPYAENTILGMIQAISLIPRVFTKLKLPDEDAQNLQNLWKLYKLRQDRKNYDSFVV